jgi:hypothetical protein
MFAESYGNPAIVQWLSPRETPMLKDTSLQTSPQLALVEQQGVVVALSSKQVVSLFKKSEQSGIPFDTLKEVYQRGYSQSLSEQIAYNRVNSFIAGGAAMEIDQDLLEYALDKPTMSAKELAKKYKEPVGKINKTIKQGEKVEREHTSSKKTAKEIARDHIGEKPDYYKKLSKMESADPCWKGYHQIGMKKKNGKSVPNCVPKEEYTGAEKVSKNSDDPSSRFDATTSLTNVYKKDTHGYSSTIKRAIKEHCGCKKEMEEDAKGYKNPTGGLTQKGRDHYNRESGGHLKAPVTTPPSKLKKGSKSANRRKSFCARMSGVEGPMKKPNGEPTRKALSLKKWNC